MAEPVQDAALQKSLLPHAHALVLREMMQWVNEDPPAGTVEAKMQMLEEMAEIAAEKAEAEARRLASPSEPKQAPALGSKRKNPGRHSKDEARLRMSGTIIDVILVADLCMKPKYALKLLKSPACKPSHHISWAVVARLKAAKRANASFFEARKCCHSGEKRPAEQTGTH